jgi:tetratricopeptide (TPR) repeat protein
LEEYDRAISDFTRAIALDPSNGIPFSLRGSIYYQQGGYASAINDYQRAILIDPEDFWALNSLAWTLAYNLDARYEEALSYAIRSVEQESNAYNQDTLALVYYKLEKFDQALDHYNIALSLDPNQAISYKYRGDVHLALGDKQAALADYEKYLSFEPVGEERDDAVNKIRELQE